MTNGINKENKIGGQRASEPPAGTQQYAGEIRQVGEGSSITTSGGTSGGTGAATAAARSFYDQAKETAGQAYDAVTEKAATKLDEQKSTLSSSLSTVADSVRQVSSNLSSSRTDSGLPEAAARYTDTAARRIEDLARYFDTHNVREMARDLEGFARRNPAIFLGAAFGLGFLVARFLKSTPPQFNTSAGAGFATAGDNTERPGEASARRVSQTNPVNKPA